MSRYRKIEVRTWSDAKFRSLSAIQPSGQGLWFYLLTGPHTTAIPGLFKAGRAGMAEDLEWSQEDFDKAFDEVSMQGMAEADFKSRLVWLPKAIWHNKPESPNVVRGWRTEIGLLPECELKTRALVCISEALAELGPSYVEAFKEVVGDTTSKASRKPSKKPSIKTSPNQEQEQEQEQEQDGGGPAPADEDPPPAACAAATTSRGSRLAKDWVLPKPWGDWALAEFPGWGPDKIRREAEAFRDHWVAKAGRDATKLDWSATWRNWCRSSIAHRDDPKPGAAGSATGPEMPLRAQTERWMAEQDKRAQAAASPEAALAREHAMAHLARSPVFSRARSRVAGASPPQAAPEEAEG